MGTGGSSNKAHPHYLNLHLAYMQCSKIFDGEKINFKNILANNIIKNHDFSEGLESWIPVKSNCSILITSEEQGNNTYKRYAVLKDRTEWWSQLQQDITIRITPGLTYALSALVAVSGSLNGKSEIIATLKLEHHDSTCSYLNIARIDVAKNEWEILKGSFVLESLPRRVFFYLEGPVPGLDLLIKSVVICPLIPSIAQTIDGENINFRNIPETNIIENHEFVHGLQLWNPISCKCFVIPSSSKSDGVYAVLTDRTKWWSQLRQDITSRLSPGLTYSVCAIVAVSGTLIGGTSEVHATLLLEYHDSTILYHNIARENVAKDKFEILQGNFMFETLPKRVSFYIEGPAAGLTLLIKSVVICPLSSGNVQETTSSRSSCIVFGAKKDGTQTWSGTQQDITGRVQRNVIYELTAVVKISGNNVKSANVIATLEVEKVNTRKQYVHISSVQASDSEWALLQGKFLINGSPSKVVIRYEGPPSGTDILLQSVELNPSTN